MTLKKREAKFVILSQSIQDKDSSGKRFIHGNVIKSNYRKWDRYPHVENNFKEAVKFITNRLNNSHIGGLVLIKRLDTGETTPLFQAKWGHDNKPFTQFQYAIGNYWKNKAKL